MLRHLFVIVIIVALCGFLYGLFNILIEVEENACRMTYMFGKPQFSRVKFEDNKYFPNYALYYYYEGEFPKDVNKMHLNGAPVIFVPGNGGSYKQVRSLASVALRKGMDDDESRHLDYFTIDFNEELSGLYGGYLEYQKCFLRISIEAVLRLYKNHEQSQRKVVLIGHSMGGKVAQSVLGDGVNIAKLINTIIFISSPLDKPVVTFDSEINAVYKTMNEVLSNTRTRHIPDCETNVCCNIYKQKKQLDGYANVNETASILEDISLISIGGGNRDLLVKAGLTTSQFSDIHAMSSSIPNVWVSCDHLSSVWCLQLVIVITRFLFTISHKYDGYVLFNNNKNQRMQIAEDYFVKQRQRTKMLEQELTQRTENGNAWFKDSKRVFKKQFKNGVKQTYNQLIQLDHYEKYKKLYIEVNNVDDNDWIYGCTTTTLSNGKQICKSATSLSHYIQTLPAANSISSVVILDLHNIKKTFTEWTHILVRFKPTDDPFYFVVDIHDPAERNIQFKMPRFFNFNKKVLFTETPQGASYFKLRIEELTESFQGMRVNIAPVVCAENAHPIRTKICVPWAAGFDRYKINENLANIYVNVPITSPHGYNTTKNPVTLEIFLHPACRYSISYQYSLADTASRIVHEFYQWLPSHLTAIIFIVLKNEFTKLQTNDVFHFVKPYKGYFQYSSLFIITGCRILKKLLLPFKFVPMTLVSTDSFYVSLIIHSTAIAMSILFAFGAWAMLVLQGNILYKVALRITKIPFVLSSPLTMILTNLPITFGVITIAISLRTCSGVALIIGCAFYFMMISNSFKDFVEDWLWRTAMIFLHKIRNSNFFSWGKTKSTAIALLNDSSTDHLDENYVETENEPLNQSAASSVGVEAQKKRRRSSNQCEGLENFSFHITMFLLLFVLTLMNFGVTLAWIKNKRRDMISPDPSLLPASIVLVSLSLLLQMKAPTKAHGQKIMCFLLYICASACIVFCQETVFLLNYLIAFVFAAVLAQEFLSRIWTFFNGS